MNAVLNLAFNAVLAGLFLVPLGALFGRANPLIDSFGPFLLPAIVGAAALALLALLAARYAVGLLAIVALLANLAMVWPWIQDQPAAQTNGPRFKVLLFNVYYHNPRLELVAPLARNSDADIVVLLEVVPHVLAKLDAVKADYPYQIEFWDSVRSDALILSRFPLTDTVASLPPARTPRSLASATVDIKGRTLTLFAAHFTLPFPFRNYADQPAQAEDLAAAITASAGPRLLVGDFNAAAWGATMAHIRATSGMRLLTGSGGSWPSFLPRQMGIPIDHVLASPELTLLSRELIDVSGSDHRAVLAEIAFEK
ncbi:MAG: endonuclease/exonuclease/phosphatase family protein [Alphaproteobacteria bacterium]|nr:endonuclease/exonuclease/phosphatase family protein [Alphaproteobacteria bacterium]